MDEHLIEDNQTVEPEKLDLRSQDIAENKQQELLNLFPEVRTEGGKIDIERLKLALGESVDTGKERYGMNWPGKADCFKTIQMPSLATLRPCPEESINFDTTENLIIEGDNLEVLKLLQKSYLGKVKMIYIDPPYNTGNDFIYPDNYSESLQTYLEYTGQVDAEGRKFGTNTDTDGRFHSKWLNMMYPRLYLARNLLREDGVIFVSINDVELQNLRSVLNETFGEENWLGTIVWKGATDNNPTRVAVEHEYVACYARDSSSMPAVWKNKSDDAKLAMLREYERLREISGNKPDNIKAEFRRFVRDNAESLNSLTHYNRVDERGPYTGSRKVHNPKPGGYKYDVEHPITKKVCIPPVNGYRFPKATMDSLIAEGRILFGDDETQIIQIKEFLNDYEGKLSSVINLDSRAGANEMEALLDDRKVFPHPKPAILLKGIFDFCLEDHDLVLDFFAGSGTTAHAVLDLNKQDGGKRKFILVQLPEPTERKDFPTIADITKERVRRVIQKLNDDDSQQSPQQSLALTPTPALPLKWGGSGISVPSNIKNLSGGERNSLKNKGSGGIVPSPCEGEGQDGGADVNKGNSPDRGFKVFKLAESNFNPWNADVPHEAGALEQQLDLHVDHIRDGRTADDLLYELLLKSGFPLTTLVQKLSFDPEKVKFTVFSVQQEGLKTESLKTEHSPVVYSVANGALFICLERDLTLELIRAMAERKPERVVCLDEGFARNDQLKANAVQIFKTKGVTSFKTV